ncbi:YcaO-like family protein [Mycetocola lacteus]|uniref:YcaO-like family protein n=1 Tax=Mycetocola lacteus TaxID=76637 RepID=UPI00160407FF|nr:YcaO-like family protein [Mycetocola lacteus]
MIGQLESRMIISAVGMIMDGLAKLPGRFVGREFELDLLALTIRIHPMLPLPNRVVAAYAGEHTWGDLVDERSGIITHVATAHDSGVISATARIADLSMFEPLWIDDRQGFGMSTRAGKHVEAAAVSEILEAYGGFLWESTAEHLEKRNGVVSVMGKDFVSGKARSVAASQIYLNWYRREGVMPSASTSTNISGIAAGPSLDFAVVSALQELIERDAMTVWWLNGPVLPRRVASRECLIRLGLLRRPGVALHFIDLPSPTGVPTVVAILAGMTPNPILGFSTRHTTELAEEKAALEALLLVRTVTGLDDPKSELWTAIIEGRVDRGALREWRQDRAYAMDFGGPHNVTDLLSQLQYNLDPHAAAEHKHIFSGPVTEQIVGEPLANASVSAYRDRLGATGIEVAWVDLTPPDLALCGAYVARVVGEEFVGNAPAAFAPVKSRRVVAAGIENGWRGPNEPFTPNAAPMPYA